LGGTRHALCLCIIKGKGKLYASSCSKRKVDSTLKRRLSNGGEREKDKKILCLSRAGSALR
jgi:hypothetical protein